jgi:dipeptide/tripeptide permease
VGVVVIIVGIAAVITVPRIIGISWIVVIIMIVGIVDRSVVIARIVLIIVGMGVVGPVAAVIMGAAAPVNRPRSRSRRYQHQL